VIELPTDNAKFGLSTADAAGESNENALSSVPATAPTVICKEASTDAPEAIRQLAEVCEVHEAEVHA
jgi:hypothetical protein